jgi:hypothetical protein
VAAGFFCYGAKEAYLKYEGGKRCASATKACMTLRVYSHLRRQLPEEAQVQQWKLLWVRALSAR